jgi:hypothetical protein
MVNIISDYIPPFASFPNIAPFTYKDGETYLSTLDDLRTFVNVTLVTFVNTNYGLFGDAFTVEIAALTGQINTVITAMNTDVASVQTLHDQVVAFVATVNTAVTAANDSATASANSATNSNTSATNSATSATNAAASELLTMNAIAVNVRTYGTNFAAIRSALSAAASAGVKRVLAQDSYVHDGGAVLVVPPGVNLEFAKESLVTVPSNIAVGIIMLSDKSSINGMNVEGGGTKATNTHAIDSLSGATVSIKDITIKHWNGDPIFLHNILTCNINNIVIEDTTNGGAIRIFVDSTYSTDINGVNINNVIARRGAGTMIQVDGEWNRSDWRVAGRKVRNVHISNCHAEYGLNAGIFINSVFEGTITGCTAVNNGDYGIGLEYCYNVAVTGCSTRNNATFGFATYQSNQAIAITGCTTRNNTQHGFYVHSANTVVGDTASSDITITACTSESNTQHGFITTDSLKVIFANCISIANTKSGYYISSVDTSVIGCKSYNNTEHGLQLFNSDNCQINDGAYSNNIISGINLTANISDALLFTSINNCLINNNPNAIIFGSNVQTTKISNCIISNCSGAGIIGIINQVVISNNIFRVNGGGGMYLPAPIDLTVNSNSFYNQPGSIGISVKDSAGISGKQIIICNNVIHSGGGGSDIGIAISIGSGVAAGDDGWLDNNKFLGVFSSQYQFVTMGTVANLEFNGSIFGTPNGVIAANIGSICRRTDGGAATSLYIKESGVNTNTGWVAK